jgi:small GTP-binding protein
MPKEIKIVLLGNSGVGKTSILTRVELGRFETRVRPTVGVGASHLRLPNPKGGTVEFAVWDTAGQDQFRTLVPMYFRGAAAAIVTFSLADRKSFDDLDEWVQMLHEFAPDCEIGLVGNKADLEDERAVQYPEAEQKSIQIGAGFYIETSAANGQGCPEIFSRFMESPGLEGSIDGAGDQQNAPSGAAATQSVALDTHRPAKAAGGCC